MKYVVYATNKNGDGFTTKIGVYEDVYEITIRVGHFKEDVVITIEEDHDDELK